MKVVRKYSDYLVYQLLESVMVTTSEFKDIIGSMPESDKISDILYTIISDKKDIKTNYNLVDLTPDNNDEISFLPDNQYQRFITKGEDVATKKKSNGKIGRMIGQILRDNGHTQFKDTDIEKFINSFKTAWNKKHGITNRRTQLVKGQDIKKWYDQKTYNSSGGTLGNSCMRYEHVNHFMNIYAENPDKISMVILTEDDKLLGRALFWNLDYSVVSNKKYYLDRIYTEQDSDVQFIYDWVVDNLVGKDVKILASHKNGDNGNEMKVNLSKTNFEHYPYADSFNYLYQKINNGKLTDEGYVSNWSRYDEVDIIKDYVVSEIRNHSSGTPSILSHRYSERLGIYIIKDEAVSTNDGWVPKSMCKKCKYTSDWILEEDAVYSEAMNDWIPKDDAIESEKFGWVLPDIIIKVATKYIGKYTEPLDVYTALEKGESLFEVDEILNTNSQDYFYPEYRPGRQIYYSKDLEVKDFWNEPQISITCYQVYRSANAMDDDDSIFGQHSFVARGRNGYVLLTKEDAELFNIEIDLKNPKWMSSHDIRARYNRNMNYTKFVEFVKNSKLSDDIKFKIIEMKTKFHESLLETESSYRLNFEISTKLGDVSKLDLFNELLNKSFDRLIEKRKETVVRYIYEKFTTQHEIELSEEQMESLVALIKSYAGAYMYHNDTSDARDQLLKWIGDKNVGVSELISYDRKVSLESVAELIRRSWNSGIDDLFFLYRNQVAQELSEKYDVSSESVYKYATRGYSSANDINPYK